MMPEKLKSSPASAPVLCVPSAFSAAWYALAAGYAIEAPAYDCCAWKYDYVHLAEWELHLRLTSLASALELIMFRAACRSYTEAFSTRPSKYL